MICPLSDNYRTAMVKTISMLKELELHQTAEIVFFLAAIDYSEDYQTIIKTIGAYLRQKRLKKEDV